VSYNDEDLEPLRTLSIMSLCGEWLPISKAYSESSGDNRAEGESSGGII
jgi:hypothetical protein